MSRMKSQSFKYAAVAAVAAGSALLGSGLIKDVPTCAELIERIMAEAREIVTGRLSGIVV